MNVRINSIRPFTMTVAAALGALALGTAARAAAEGPEAHALCIVGNHDGIEDADARTATGIVCDALRERGVRIGEPQYEWAPGASATYRVSLERLGTSMFVVLQQEDGQGHLVTQRRMQLAAIEETPVIAPRLAEAILGNQSLATTQKVSNISLAEGRKIAQLSGDFGWGPKLGGAYFIGRDSAPVPLFGMQFMYETEHAAFGGGFEMIFGGDGEEEIFGFMAEAGGRYLLLAQDTTPYFGGGLTIASLDYDWDTEASGLGAYAEVGVEFLRLHRTHFTAGLRADLPFFATKSSTAEYGTDGMYTGTVDETKYIPLVSLQVGVLF